MLAFLFKGRRPRETKGNCCIVTRPFFHPDTPLDINLLWHGDVETKLDARSPLSLTLIYDCCRLAANKEMMNRPTKHTPQVESPLDFATVYLVANLALATSRAVTDLHQYINSNLGISDLEICLL